MTEVTNRRNRPLAARTIHRYAATLGFLACSHACSRSDPGAREVRELERVEEQAQLARREAAAAASAKRAREVEEAELRARRKEACKELAQNSRNCIAGKPCQQVTPGKMRLCAEHMRDEGLDKNPYAQE